jgi:hypothetical protein
VEQEHQRVTDWESVADGTLEPLASIVGELMTVVGEVGAPPVGCHIWTRYPDAVRKTSDLSEFREVAADLPRKDAYAICLVQAPAPNAKETEAPSPELSVALSLRHAIKGPVINLTVSGRSRTAVEGVNVRAKELVEQMIDSENEAARAAEEAARAADEHREELETNKRRQVAKLAEGATPARGMRTRAQRFLQSPWAVEIVGGIVVVVFGTVLAILFL